MEKHVIMLRGKYLYKTYLGTYLFADKPNVFFNSYEQAQNWLWNNHKNIASDNDVLLICPCPKVFIQNSKENNRW